jgi:hypothetical protein
MKDNSSANKVKEEQKQEQKQDIIPNTIVMEESKDERVKREEGLLEQLANAKNY